MKRLINLLILSMFFYTTFSLAALTSDDASALLEKCKQNDQTALQTLKTNADSGDAIAQLVIGIAYELGYGVAKDDAQAVNWYRKAAEQGNASAQFNMGNRYNNGRGVAKDYAQAVNWYRKAAEQGLAFSQFILGAMYNDGRGVAKDYVQAVNWFRKAAEQGDANAQNNLGAAFENEHGVPQLRVVAYALYNLAAINNNKEAIYNRTFINKKMTAEEFNAAQTLTRQMLEKGNFLAALDKYVAEPLVKEKA
jgi:uncharacterized protein